MRQCKSFKSSDGHNLIYITPRRNTETVINLLETVKCLSVSGHMKETTNISLEKSSTQNKIPESNNSTIYYTVLWAKISSKKHKTWEGDGTLEANSDGLKLYNEQGNMIGCSKTSNIKFEPGKKMCIGGKEIEVVEEKKNNISANMCSSLTSYETDSKASQNTNVRNSRIYKNIPKKHEQVVFPKPASEHQWQHDVRKSSVHRVALESVVNNILRPHQKEGVIFLYECVMGFRNSGHNGAILADEMGLGKTLQCIALIWTLLRQGPYGSPVCRKILIMTPSSLCFNWQKEFQKWLGRQRIETFVVNKSNNVTKFMSYPLVPIMIISYEMFIRNFTSVETINFDLMVFDEGHRLKNSSAKAVQLLSKLQCKKRILLTGTPVQNDLEEYYSVVNIVNPGILGDYGEFRKNYELPILAAKQPNACSATRKTGEEKSVQLKNITSRFLLRRTQEIMNSYLPLKEEFIIFCSLTDAQKSMYEKVIDQWFVNRDENPFSIIAKLRKICSHPCLLEENINEGSKLLMTENSVKIALIESILTNTINNNEGVVLVSYFTLFLDLLESFCKEMEISCLRLDGSTAVAQRKSIVEAFNNKKCKVFLLSARAGGTGLNLVGGTRLVLADGDWNPSNDMQAIARIWRDGQKRKVKIYRLICTGTIEEKIFQRQLSKIGLNDCVEDPDNIQKVMKFSEEELKDLFTPNFETASMTHDLLSCSCNKLEASQGRRFHNKTISESIVESCSIQLKEWKHCNPPLTINMLQDMGIQPTNCHHITFILQKSQDDSK